MPKFEMKTRYHSILPRHDAYQCSPSDILKRALHKEYVCLHQATAREGRKPQPRAYMLDEDSKCEYRGKPLDIMPTAHCGQLKLFCSELWLLVMYASRVQTLVYAGAASGKHISLLAELFPTIHFVLYDSRPFHRALLNYKNVTMNQRLFTNEEATRWAGQNILFVSDIRSGDPLNPMMCNFEECVSNDMRLQKEWVLIMKPHCSMLKFRLPYAPGKSTYFLGQLRYGIFAAQSTTEMRLMVRDVTKEIIYDNTDIEERCYFFNNFTRVARYHSFFGHHPTLSWDSLGIDFCWDCCTFLKVCMSFLASEEENEILFNFVERCIDVCGAAKKLKQSPHGDAFEQWISKRKTYHGSKIFSLGTTKLLDTKVVDFIHRICEAEKDVAPPLGRYCGTLNIKSLCV